MVPPKSEKSEWQPIILPHGEKSEDGTRIRMGQFGGRVYASESFRPVLVLGPQRSYKTSGFAIPAILDWQGPALITSVRRDVIDDTFAWRRQLGNVAIFDPSGSLKNTRYAKYRHSWDFLDYCESWDDCVRTGLALTEAGRLGGVTEGDFWYALAGQLLAPHLLAAVRYGYNITDVVRWVKTQEQSLVRSLLKDIGHAKAMTSAEDAWKREDRAKSSIYTTASSVLRIFEYDDIAVTRPPFIDLHGLLASKGDTLYICAPPDDQEEYRPIFTALVRTLVRLAYANNTLASDQARDLSPEEQLKIGRRCDLLLLLDEAGNIAPLENLGTLATTAAGTGIQMVTVFHDLSQIEGLYKSAVAHSILNNHSALMVLPGCKDAETLSYVQSLLQGERVANSVEGEWVGPRPIRSMERGQALLIYENLRPVMLSLRSKFTSGALRDRVDGSKAEIGS